MIVTFRFVKLKFDCMLWLFMHECKHAYMTHTLQSSRDVLAKINGRVPELITLRIWARCSVIKRLQISHKVRKEQSAEIKAVWMWASGDQREGGPSGFSTEQNSRAKCECTLCLSWLGTALVSPRRLGGRGGGEGWMGLYCWTCCPCDPNLDKQLKTRTNLRTRLSATVLWRLLLVR